MFQVEETAGITMLTMNMSDMSEKEQGDQCGRVG